MFGNSRKDYIFTFSPYNEKDRWSGNYFRTYGNIRSSRGVLTAPEGTGSRFGYNMIENVLYVSSYREFTSWLLPGCEKYEEYKPEGWNNVDAFASSLYDSKMVAVYGGRINILEGKDMKSVKTISYPMNNNLGGPFLFTEDGKFICFTYDNGYKGLVYDVKAELYDFPYLVFDIPVITFDLPQISYDARYLVLFESTANLIVLTLDDFKVVKTERLNVRSYSYCFNPFITEELYIESDNNVLIYNMKDLSLIDVLDYPGMHIGNIDPQTGYLVLYNDNSIKIIDTKTKQLLYSIPADSGTGAWLYGNTLISDKGFALNLDKYIVK